MKKWLKPIAALKPCQEALNWAEAYSSLTAAWASCERGDWMLWLLGKLVGPPESDSRRRLTLAACACARLALPHISKGETRPLQSIETAEKWARGEEGITLDDVRLAARAAYAAYATAYATYTADDATCAAYAAYAAARAAYATAYAAYTADDTDAEVYNQTLAKCADIVREYYPGIGDYVSAPKED